MTKDVQRADRVVLVGWADPIDSEDVLDMTREIDRARQAPGGPLVAILSIDQDVALLSMRVRVLLVTSLPRILTWCSKFVLALSPTTLRHRFVRSFFLTQAADSRATERIQLCDSLPEAFEYAQRLAPQQVLRIQRQMLKHAAHPEGDHD